jgi:catechol 2,3-dioxygenase-like lactoylglutathione lyase family enzyme
MKLNGIAHIQLTVADLQRSRAFWAPMLELFEMKTLIDTDDYFYGIGSRTGVAISPVDPMHREDRFDQKRVGLHHVCFRARSREDVDEVHRLACDLGARVVHPPQEDAWAPGYYSVLLEDPDGIRVEVNFVPGRGHLSGSEAM